MILRLKDNDFLRMLSARGVAIEVLRGRVWITEDGRRGDAFLGPGRCYAVAGDGMVLVGVEPAGGLGAEISLAAGQAALRAMRACPNVARRVSTLLGRATARIRSLAAKRVSPAGTR